MKFNLDLLSKYTFFFCFLFFFHPKIYSDTIFSIGSETTMRGIILPNKNNAITKDIKVSYLGLSRQNQVSLSCWPSFDSMVRNFNSGISATTSVNLSPEISIENSNAILANPGDHTIGGLVKLYSTRGFDNISVDAYCTAMPINATYPFSPEEITYNILHIIGSSDAYAYIETPSLIDLGTCNPQSAVNQIIPVTVNSKGNGGLIPKVSLTISSDDLPDDFGIFIGQTDFLNNGSYEMIGKPENLLIESEIKGYCPKIAGEYIWNVKYTYTYN